MPSKLDQEQIIKQVYDENDNRLRVDATVSASIGDVSIVDSDGNELNVNPDGSINTNISGSLALDISAADGDNIAISDGVDTLAINADGSLNAQVTAVDLDIRNLNSATDSVTVVGALTDAELRASPVPVSGVDLDIRDLNSATDSVTAIGPLTNAELRASPVDITAVDLDIRNLNSATDSVTAVGPLTDAELRATPVNVEVQQPVQIAGTNDGTPTGTQFGIVYNVRQQVLDSDDREDDYTYADFGTKDQRITRIEYTSPTFAGFIVRRDFNYVLDGGRYRRTNSIWSIV
jgi:hypothetical protein